jgi:hypothetical protein
MVQATFIQGTGRKPPSTAMSRLPAHALHGHLQSACGASQRGDDGAEFPLPIKGWPALSASESGSKDTKPKGFTT